MKKDNYYRHCGQIVTKKKYIYECLNELEDDLQSKILKCIRTAKFEDKDIKYIVHTLWWLNKLVYLSSSNQIRKIKEEKYKLHLFESNIPELKWLKTEDQKYCIKKYYRLVDFLTHMLAVENEVYLPCEFEYVMHYVIENKEIVDKPIFENKNGLFPINLKDFNVKDATSKYYEE